MADSESKPQEIEIPRELICAVGYWEINSAKFDFPGFEIISVERYNGDEYNSNFRSVVKHVETGRFFQFEFVHSHSYHDIEPDQYGDGPVEVFPHEVVTVVYTTQPKDSE